MVILAEQPEVTAVHGLGGAARDAVARVQELRRRRDEAVWLGIVGHVDRTGSYLDDGHRTAACWVVTITNCAKPVAARQVRTARMFHDLAQVASALFDGHIGSTQVEQLLRLWSNPRVRDALTVLETELVERASLMPPDDFQQVCDMIRLFADPDGGHRDHETSRENRHLSLVPDGAGFRLHVEGDALSGALFEETLARYAQAEFDADWAAGKAEHGDRMCPALLRRTNRQRRFDAFIAMIRVAANGQAAHDLVPLVTIHCDQRTAEEVIREHFATEDAATDRADENDADDDWSTVDLGAHGRPPQRPVTNPDDLLRRRCHTDTGAPVDRDDLLIAMLIGRVRTVIHGHDGRVIALGHSRRLFRGGAREAALLTGRRCTVAGCQITSGRLEIDHTLAWAARHGPTNQDNADVLCGHHNKAKERLGLVLTRNPDLPGGWITYRCDGSRIGIRTSPATSPPDLSVD